MISIGRVLVNKLLQFYAIEIIMQLLKMKYMLSTAPAHRHTTKVLYYGWVPDLAIKSTKFFGFPVQMKVMFTVYCSLLSVQQDYV